MAMPLSIVGNNFTLAWEERAKERKKTLEKTKSELVSLEREIFVIKKGLQEEGALG